MMAQCFHYIMVPNKYSPITKQWLGSISERFDPVPKLNSCSQPLLPSYLPSATVLSYISAIVLSDPMLLSCPFAPCRPAQTCIRLMLNQSIQSWQTVKMWKWLDSITMNRYDLNILINSILLQSTYEPTQSSQKNASNDSIKSIN